MSAEPDPVPEFVVDRSNTVLYCSQWLETVDFYRTTLELAVSFENDWFVEFAIRPGVSVSIADARRATIPPGHGAGITLSWQVRDIGRTSEWLSSRGVVVSPIATRWGAPTAFFRDPEGHRIELWAPAPGVQP